MKYFQKKNIVTSIRRIKRILNMNHLVLEINKYKSLLKLSQLMVFR